MRILVTVKRVVDHSVKVNVKPDGSGVDLSNVRMSMNPFDEIAVEEAVRLKERGVATEIVAVSVGTSKSQDTLRTALALGADRAILVECSPDQLLEPLSVAKVLQRVVDEESPQIVLMGKQAIDDDYNQTGQMLSALLGWSQGTFASKVDLTQERLLVTREIDGGKETLCLQLPAVITADLRLNEPRYPSLPNIMKAKRKPLQIRPISELDIDISPRVRILKTSKPPPRRPGILLDSVDELVECFQSEAGVE